MWLTDLIGKVVRKLFPKNDLEKKLGISIAVSSDMQLAIQQWNDMYLNQPNWKRDGLRTMNLSAAIAHEFARLIMIENQIEITGSPFGKYLNTQLKNSIKDTMKAKVEVYCALGGIAMKPYVSGGNILVDFTQADAFYPTDYDSNGTITGAIFVDAKRIGKYVYTRLETHKFERNVPVMDESLPSEDGVPGEPRMTNTHTVTNRAFRSEQLISTKDEYDLTCQRPLSEEVPLTEVPDWADLEPSVTIRDVEKPLFVYVRVPSANNVDKRSPLGASVYSKAVENIRDADEQYSESKFEFDALQAAIDADVSLFKLDREGKPVLPRGMERVYRHYDVESAGSGTMNKPFFEVTAPSFRDASLFNGLDHYLKYIEFLCELSFGTISDPTSVEKTASEIEASKQRSYSAVCSMQEAWDSGLKDLVYCMSVLAQLYELAPVGDYDVNIMWGDGILEDYDKEYQRRWSMVLAGKYKLELFLAWHFGVSVEEALKMIPEQEPGPEFPEEE